MHAITNQALLSSNYAIDIALCPRDLKNNRYPSPRTLFPSVAGE